MGRDQKIRISQGIISIISCLPLLAKNLNARFEWCMHIIPALGRLR
jgi:hypothetical protein